MLECLLCKIGGLKHLCAFVKLVEDQWIYKFANGALVQCCSEIWSSSRSNRATSNKARIGTHRAQRSRTAPHRTPGTCMPRFPLARQFVRCAPPHACAGSHIAPTSAPSTPPQRVERLSAMPRRQSLPILSRRRRTRVPCRATNPFCQRGVHL
jgi:hypothetical protein